MTKRSRPAFSLFELLVILAILGLLMALLFPALFKVRQAADRAKSVNNLKQLALACHNYHDAYGMLPPGNDANNYSTAAKLLPFVEQDNVYKLLAKASDNLKKPVTDKANDQVRQIRIPVFLSPNDPLMGVKANVGATNYLFNAGAKPGLKDDNGIFYQDSKIKFADIVDGTSNTWMIGETLKGDGGTKAVDLRRQHILLKKDDLKDLNNDSGVKDFADNEHIAGDRCASWLDGRFLQGTFTGTRLFNDQRPDVNCEGAGGLSALRSATPYVNFAFCDGSVRSSNKAPALDVIKALAGRDDGTVINQDF
jgi:prepilin-type processing-associated H-X9-DG protein